MNCNGGDVLPENTHKHWLGLSYVCTCTFVLVIPRMHFTIDAGMRADLWQIPYAHTTPMQHALLQCPVKVDRFSSMPPSAVVF